MCRPERGRRTRAAQDVCGEEPQLLPEEGHVGLGDVHALQDRDRRLPLRTGKRKRHNQAFVARLLRFTVTKADKTRGLRSTEAALPGSERNLRSSR